jgi:hypothetical protein
MKHAREDYNRIQDPENIIPDDEPVFLLRAKDVCAPLTIEKWCEFAADYGVSKDMIDAAYEHAQKMRSWQREHGSQVPDMPDVQSEDKNNS